MGGAARLRTLAICACAIVGVSCSAFTSVDGLSGGSAHDAASSPADAGEDSSEASEADAGTIDASVPSAFCASQTPAPTFCDDFDTAALAERWDERKEESGAALNVDSVASRSPPNSFVAMTGASTPASDAVRGRVCHTVARTTRRLRAEFVELIEQMSPTELVDLASIRLEDSSSTFYATLSVDQGTRWKLRRSVVGPQSVPDTALDVSAPIELDAWTRFRIEITLADHPDAATMSASITVDVEGRRAVDTTVAIPFAPVSSQLCIGITYAKLGTRDTRVRFDDVILDLTN